MFPHPFNADHSDCDSGALTPPLWHTSPSDTPCGNANMHRCLSPGLRRQAILQGQKDLMDMVRNIPESCYELSLKDLVKLPRPPSPSFLFPREEKRPSLDEYYGRRSQGNGNRTVTTMRGRGSLGKGQRQEGLLLKTVFPVHTGMGMAGARGRRTGNWKQRKERSEEDCSEEWWRKQGIDSKSRASLSSSTIGGSGKRSSGTGSSCWSRRSNSAIDESNSIVPVRHEKSGGGGGGCCSFLLRKRR